ncbi:MAG: polyprenyl synthetase family protein [Armatimonadota bacterium]|nr:polyprenyl synthetase family protein [bacterium]
MSIHAIQSRGGGIRPEWANPIAAQLDMVEQKLLASVRSDVSVASDLSMHLFSAGGKRIRPSLVLLSAMATGSAEDRAVEMAAATELVHVASLVHDDVVDETRERRGVRTAHSMWGNKISVLGGDFLLAKAFSILANDGDADIFRVISGVAVGMIESEILQAQSEGSMEAWQANYNRIINGKTAAFMSACCEVGAILGGANDVEREALARYGTLFGLAFQITDDILDIVGDPAQTGKDAGTDLMNGKFTMPVLLALKNPAFRLAVPPLVLEGHLTGDDTCRITRHIIECGAVGEARDEALGCVQRAREQLSLLPRTDYKVALEMLAESVIERTT